MKHKAFIFDMDGVIVDTARLWHSHETAYLQDIFGPDLVEELGDRVGVDIKTIYLKAKKLGANVSYKSYNQGYDKLASIIYNHADITEHLDKLVNVLEQKHFQIALVSNAKHPWINIVLKRLPYSNKFQKTLSVYNNGNLRIKPEPDGYSEMMHLLKATPKATIILEDSNSGIEAAKESGAFVIALKENKVKGYKQTGANMYIETIKDLVKFVEKIDYVP